MTTSSDFLSSTNKHYSLRLNKNSEKHLLFAVLCTEDSVSVLLSTAIKRQFKRLNTASVKSGEPALNADYTLLICKARKCNTVTQGHSAGDNLAAAAPCDLNIFAVGAVTNAKPLS